jgi:SulP family sulfate permease
MHSLEILHERCRHAGVSMVFSHVNDQPMRTMKKAGFYDAIGEENFCKHIDDALKRAGEM